MTFWLTSAIPIWSVVVYVPGASPVVTIAAVKVQLFPAPNRRDGFWSSQLGGLPAMPTKAAFCAEIVIETFCDGGTAPLWTAANDRLVGAIVTPGAVERSGALLPPPPPPPQAATNSTSPAHAMRAPR